VPPRTISEDQLVSPRWFIAEFDHFLGGLNTSLDKHLIRDTESPNSENVIVRNGRLVVDTGYAQLGIEIWDGSNQVLFGDVRRIFEHVDNAANRSTLCVTDETVYILSVTATGFMWEPLFRGGTATSTLAVAAVATDTTITLAVGGGALFNDPDIIGLNDDNGDTITRKITGIAGDVITLDTALPATFAAAIGNVVRGAPIYTGTDLTQVVWTAWPPLEWTIWTNGKDKIQRYDGTTVEKVPGLDGVGGDPNVATCGTLTTFKNYVVLGNMTEGGAQKPFRVRWCDTGDPTEWDPTASNAGFQDLVDTRDAIKAMKGLADDNIIYRTRSIVKQEFVDTAATLFNFRTVVHGLDPSTEGVGTVSPLGVAGQSDRHLILAADGVYEYRGAFSVVKLSDPVFRGIFDVHGELDEQNAFRSFTHFVAERDDVYFFYVIAGGTYPQMALILNVPSGVWSKRKFKEEFSGFGLRVATNAIQIKDLVGTIIEQQWTFLSASVSGEIPTLVLGGVTNRTYDYNFLAGSDDGVAIPWRFETKEIHNLHRQMRFDRYDFLLAGDSVTIMFSVDGGNTFVSLGTFSPGPALDVIRSHHQVVSDRFTLRFSGNGGGAQISSLSIKHREERRWSLTDISAGQA